MAGGISTNTDVSHDINDDVNTNIPALPDAAGTSATDVRPAWETDALPGWVVYWLIPMLTAGQSWPKASESKLWQLRLAYEDMVKVASASFEPAGTSVRTISAGYEAVSEILARARVSELFGDQAGMLEKMVTAYLYSRQTDSFAQNTQYSKISVNVAFWVAVAAAFIALLASFFTAGATASLVGPYAAAGRIRIAQILERLALAAGRPFETGGVARITALAGNSAAGRFVSTALVHELVEEIGEEVFIDAYSQYKQIKMGTRNDFDWNMTKAAAIGAGAGAFVGMKLHGRVSSFADNLPGIRTLNRTAGDLPGVANAFRRFPGRAMNTGLNNVAASPAGSFLANGVVYGQWQAPTADSMVGGFMGGAGRTNTISPFNLDVYHAVTNPSVSLAGAFHTAAATDAAYAGATGPHTAADPQATAAGHNGTQNGTVTPVVGVADPTGLNPVTQVRSGQAAGGTDTGRTTGVTLDPSTRTIPAARNGTHVTTSEDTARPAVDDTLPAGQTVNPAGDGTHVTAGVSHDASAPATHTSAGVADQTVTQGDQAGQVNPVDQTGQPHMPADPNGAHVTGPAHATVDPQTTTGTSTPGQDTRLGGFATDPQTTGPQTTGPQTAGPHATGPQAAHPQTTPVSGDTTTDRPGSPRHTPGSTTDDPIVAALVDRWVGRADARQAPHGAATAPNGAADTHNPSEAHRTDFGLVAAGRIRRTAFVADGRQGPVDLSVPEARTSFDADLRPTDFGPDVSGWSWSADGTTLRVDFHERLGRAPQHFHFEVGPVRRGRLGRTSVRSGTSADPHRVRLAPRVAGDQVPRLMLHEISDTFQAQTAAEARAGQSAIRRFLSRVAGRRDGCLSARLNEHWYLSRKWQAATTADARQAYRTEIEGVARFLRRRGHMPPSPPWSGGGPHSGVTGTSAAIGGARPTTGPNADLADLRANLHAGVTGTTDAIADLRQGLGDQLTALDQAGNELHRLATENDDAVTRLSQEGNEALADGDPDRARELHDAALRHRQAADAYRALRDPATQTHDAYRTAGELLDRLAGGGPVDLRDIDAAIQGARTRHEAFQRSLAGAGQSLSSGDPDMVIDAHTEVHTARIARDGAAADLRHTLDRQIEALDQAAADQRRAAEYLRAAAQRAFELAQQAAGGPGAQEHHDAGVALNDTATAYDDAAGLADQASAAYRASADQLDHLMSDEPFDLAELDQSLGESQAHHAGYQRAVADRPLPADIAQAIHEADHPPEPRWPEVADLRGRLSGGMSDTILTATALRQEAGDRITGLDQVGDELRRLATEHHDASLRLSQEESDALAADDPDRARELHEAAERRRRASDLHGELRDRVVRARDAYRTAAEQLDHLVNGRPVDLGELAQAVQDAQTAHEESRQALAANGQDDPSGDSAATVRLHTELTDRIAGRNRLAVELQTELRRQIDALGQADAELQRLSVENNDDAVRLAREATTAAGANASRGTVRVLREAALRHQRSGDAYSAMRTPAAQARDAYEAAAGHLSDMVSDAGFRPGDLERDLEAARRHQVAYREALDKERPPDDDAAAILQAAASRQATDVRPPDAALPSTVPAGPLPIGHLTDLVNRMLARNGIDHHYTVEELQRELRGDFRRLVSEDGAVLAVADGEVQIKLKVADLRMVPGTDTEASETILGTLPQGGASISSSANRSTDWSVALDPATMAKLTPWEWARHAAQFAILKGGTGYNWSGSETHRAAEYGLQGIVEDDRGGHTMFETPEPGEPGGATFEVRVRRSAEGPGHGWSTAASADTDGSVRLWVSHAYTESRPPDVAQLAEAERQKTALPESSVTGMTGLTDLADRTSDAMGLDPGHDAVARQQVQTLIDELPARLTDAVHDPEGVQQTITEDGKKNGKVIGSVQITSRIVLEPAEDPRVGPASDKRWLERLRVGFSHASRDSTTGRTRHYSVTGGVTVSPAELHALNHIGGVSPRLSGGYSRSRSRSRTVTAGGTAIHPSVQRWAGHTQGYRLTVKHTVTIHMASERQARPAITGESKALFRMPEPHAYRYGLPVDAAAIVRDANGVVQHNPDGSVRLRDDPSPDPPKGRKAALPEWFGRDGMRGAGPALVEDVTGVEEVRAKVEEYLRGRGLLPRMENGQKVYSRDPVRRASQMANEREVAGQFTAGRHGTGYDLAAQEGLHLELMHNRTGHSPQNLTLRVRLDQQFGRPGFRGTSHALAVANLDIGSDSTGLTESRSTTNGGSGTVGVDAAKGPGITPSGGEAAVSYNSTHGASTSVGDTVNQVVLVENVGPTAIFEVAHKLRVDLLTSDGRAVPIVEDVDGSARLVLPADMLPSSEAHPPAPAHVTSDEALRTSRLLHMDAGDEFTMKAAKLADIKVNTPEFHELAAALNVRGMISHPEWLYNAYHTGQVTVTSEVGDSEFVTMAHLVDGDINLTMGSHAVGVNESHGWTVNGSGGAGVNTSGDPNGHLSGAISRSSSTGRSRSDTDIWATERLAIDTGNKYVFRATAKLHVSTAPNAKGETRSDSVEGRPVLYALSERDALRMYSLGDVALPLHQVADVIERLLKGDLKLDRRTAVPLARKYLLELATARRNLSLDVRRSHPTGVPQVPVTSGHTRAAVADLLSDLFPSDMIPRLASPGRRLSDILAKVRSLDARPVRVAIPEHYAKGVGISTFQRTSLHTDEHPDTDVDVLDQVGVAVNVVAPNALADAPRLLRALYVDFAGKRWWGKIDDMLGAGYTKNYGDFTVRVTAEFHDDPTSLGHMYNHGQILQHYKFEQEDVSENHNVTYEGSVSPGAGGKAHLPTPMNVHGTVKSHRSNTSSGGHSRQKTRLQGEAVFKDAEPEIRQGITVTIQVVRNSIDIAAALRGARRSHTIVLTGTVDRVLPSGMAAPPGKVSSAPVGPPDARRLTPPAKSMPERTRVDGLPDAIIDGLVKHGLLSRSEARAHRDEITKVANGNALNARFERTTDANGHRLIRILLGQNRAVDVWLRSNLSEPMVAAAGLSDTELREVDRKQTVGKVDADRSHLGPATVSVGGGADTFGVGVDGTFRSQTTEHRSTSGGTRNETSVFEKGSADKVEFRVDGDLRFEEKRIGSVDDDGQTVGTPVWVPHAVSGTTTLTLFDHELNAMLSRAETGPADRPAWQPGPSAAARQGFGRPHDLRRVYEQAAARQDFDPARPHRAMAQVLTAGRADSRTPVLLNAHYDRGAPYGQLDQARLLARELGAEVHLDVRNPDGTVTAYSATPDGGLHLASDPEFAARFSTLPYDLIVQADRNGIDLRDLDLRTRSHAGTFADQVRAELRRLAIPGHVPDQPGWPAQAPPDDADWHGQSYMGSSS